MAKAESKEVNICWMTGNYHQRAHVLRNLQSYLTSKGPYETSVYGGEVTLEYVQSQIQQRSCFEDNQRLIILNDWPAFKTTKPTMYKHFLKMCEGITDGIVLVCNNLETDADSFMKAISSIAKVYTFKGELKQWDAQGWVKGEIANREKEISDYGAEAIICAVGTKESGWTIDIDKLYMMIDKLCGYVGRRKAITDDEVIAVCTDSSDFIIWSLYPLLDAREFCNAMKLIQKGFDLEEDAKDFAESILYSMIWRYRLMLFVKEGSAQGWDTARIISEISKLHKMKRSGNAFGIRYIFELNEEKVPPKPIYNQKQVEKLFDGKNSKPPILCYNRKELYEALMIIEQTLQKIRAGATKFETICLLDSVIMSICGVGDGEQLSQLRRINNGRFC